MSDYVNMAPEELRPGLEKVFGVYYRILYGGGADSAVKPDGQSSVSAVSAASAVIHYAATAASEKNEGKH